MSYDLFVWRQRESDSSGSASGTYQTVAVGRAILPGDEGVTALAGELGRATRGSMELSVGPGYLIAHLASEMDRDEGLMVRNLAWSHGLTIYDPQAGVTLVPPG